MNECVSEVRYESRNDERDCLISDVVGAAAYLCPVEWASAAERERSARAVAEFAGEDQDLVAQSCRVARRRFAAGRLQRDVVRLLEGALVVARPRRPGRWDTTPRLRGSVAIVRAGPSTGTPAPDHV